MLVNDIALMTVAKARAMTTKIVSSILVRITNVSFVARNFKTLASIVTVWLIVTAGGYLVYRLAASNANQTFYQMGAEAAQDLATKSRPFVLGDDVLPLNMLIQELKDLDALAFAAIVNHENLILSHTNAAMINQQYRPLDQTRMIETTAGTQIISGLTIDQQPTVAFFQTIRYADVPIGRAVVALAVSNLNSRIETMRWAYAAAIAVALIGGFVLLAWLNRSRQKKHLQIRKEMATMDRIGPYVLKRKVAMGGMAELFRADYLREDGFRRRVAVKRIRPHLADNADFIRMFTREARLAALLQHPNIVQIFDYGKIDKAYFIAMEYIDGKNLGEILATMKIGLPVDQAVFIASEICKGLDYSHSRIDDETGTPLRIVHRDISPPNILISCEGEVKISDFGISKAQSEPNHTQAGVIKGKLAYMSPEQALGQPLDCRADIFALGLLFHESLTGIRVYRFNNEIEAIRELPQRDIEPLTEIIRQIPEELNRIVMKCLEKDRDARYQSAAEVYADLTAFRRESQMTYDAADLSIFMRERLTEGDDTDCVV